MTRDQKALKLRHVTGVSAKEAFRFLLLYEAVKDIEAEAAAAERIARTAAAPADDAEEAA